MIVHTIHDLSNKYVVDILVKGLSNIPEQDLAPNYHPEFNQDPANLFYILKNNRYINGSYYVLEEDGNYVGSAGWNHYTDNTALVLTRAYILPKYRTKYLMAEYFLPKIFEESTGYEKLWITCNDYNKSIYNALVKLSNGKSAGIFNSWPEIYKKFKPIGSMSVNNTPQYIAEYQK